MKPKIQNRSTSQQSEPEQEEAELETPFQDDTDICQQLMSRYSASTAPQHRHLLATAAALRSILIAESLPLTPSSYFVAAIHHLADSKTLDPTAISALLSFISIVVPLVPAKGIKEDKAAEAVVVLVGVVTGREGTEGTLGVASVKGVVKCLGVLILRFCGLEDWASLEEGFGALLKFSADKRPKVRRSAQDCLEKVLKSLRSAGVIKEASKMVLSLFKSYTSLAQTLNVDGPKDEMVSKSEHLEVLHMLNLLKLTIPYLSVKISSKILSGLLKLMSSDFSALTRHVFKCLEAFLETSRDEVVGPEAGNIINSLSLYVSSRKRNPMDTVVLAAVLLKTALDKLCVGESVSWIGNASKVFVSIAGLLTCDGSTASQASDIIKELINDYLDPQLLSTHESQSVGDASQESEQVGVVKLICATFENALSSGNDIPNEHLLGVLSTLFLKLGGISHIFMRGIVLKIADFMNHADQDASDKTPLQDCIGSAIVAMGAERILALIPISIDTDNFSCSNTWLVPILKSHVFGSSLGYYMENIVPLAKSFERASCKVKKAVISQDLQAHAHALWGLLPAFCRYPVDFHRKFGSLAELMISFLKNDSFMHQHIAIAVQVIVNQNRSALIAKNNSSDSNSHAVKDSIVESSSGATYSKKAATRNIKALESCFSVLLQALADLFIDSLPEKRLYLKDAIGCLSLISDSSITRNIFLSLLERFDIINGEGEFQKLKRSDELTEEEQGDVSSKEKDSQRHAMMELACSLILGAKEDFVNLIYNFVIYIFQETDWTDHSKAYHTLSRILEEHAWFCSSRFEEVIDLLVGLKPPTDVESLRGRFACFHILMLHILQITLEDENTKAFLILNEILLTLKDAKEETRKVAYDMLLMIGSSLKNSSPDGSGEPYHKLISMVMGYLSGSSPHIKSGAVAALSVLVYNDTENSLKIPDLVSSLLSLLQSKAVEVIKAVLGFTKVLVSCLQPKDLQNLLADILNGVLPWSGVSRNHFRSKVTVILEIMIRKCGSAAIELVTPEKYKSYLKTVLQNRHHKSTSKESGTNTMEITGANSSSKSQGKRKNNELGSPSKENGSVHHRKRRRQSKQNEMRSSSKQPRISTDDGGGRERASRATRSEYKKSVRGKPEYKNRNPKKEPKSGGKRKMDKRKMGKIGESSFKRSGFASKFHKSKKVGKR